MGLWLKFQLMEVGVEKSGREDGDKIKEAKLDKML